MVTCLRTYVVSSNLQVSVSSENARLRQRPARKKIVAGETNELG